ncbi:T9SS type A sorting domain-containing protein [Paracrocinitomix mangrovi]|uniref:T9SS type A sorting domain-containing protein n=1 Tax=Paracrocinitomix mangrovi TaxID=2862509 RepID=UPI001C8ED2D8|nr:T9SS type A sorting domain-containing protein [Paracrocinitomix mangrovi]UKN00233.1 T9SS type A sorting domain-containing protein [Paracrocinitomix mangrovi]
MKKIIAFISLSLAFVSVQAQNWIQKGIDQDGNSSNAEYGYGVSIDSSGSIVAIGSRTGSGYVNILEWNGADWQQLGSTLNGENPEDKFGAFVCLSNQGNRAVIGAPGSYFNSDSGYVKVFEWDGADWMQMGNKIMGASAGDNQGTVAMNGDGSTIVVSAPLNSDSATQSGICRVFEWDGLDWIQKGSSLHGVSSNQGFGHSTDISEDGNTIVVGAPYPFGPMAGSYVKVFEWSGSDWIQKGATLNEIDMGDKLGTSVAMNWDGSIIALGAPERNSGMDSNNGLVICYKWDGGNWVQHGQELVGFEPTNYFGAGIDISADGNFLLASAWGNDDLDTNAGSAYVYMMSGNQWNQIGDNIYGEAKDDWLGRSKGVKIDYTGANIILGSYKNDGGGVDAGHARIFGLDVASIEENGFSDDLLYPNPVSETLKIQSINDQVVKYEMYSISGQKVMVGQSQSSNLSIDVSALKDGVYVISFITDSGDIVKKKFSKI